MIPLGTHYTDFTYLHSLKSIFLLLLELALSREFLLHPALGVGTAKVDGVPKTSSMTSMKGATAVLEMICFVTKFKCCAIVHLISVSNEIGSKTLCPIRYFAASPISGTFNSTSNTPLFPSEILEEILFVLKYT